MTLSGVAIMDWLGRWIAKMTLSLFIRDDGREEETRIGAKLSRAYVDIVAVDKNGKQLGGKRVWGTWYDGVFTGQNPCFFAVQTAGVVHEVHAVYFGCANIAGRFCLPVEVGDTLQIDYKVINTPMQATA